LKKFGFRATCYIVSGRLGEHNVWDADLLKVKKPLMNRAELQAWLAAGHEIGSHTVTHPRLNQISAQQATTEIFDSRVQLSELTGATIQHFCYPYGEYNAETLERVRAAGYRSAVTTQRGLVTRGDDALRLPRVSVNGDKGLFKFALKAATPYAGLGRRRAA
jgi:peptidoglycan/xylan/chitin deacetylase (PgdA/CDA1 family)